MIEPASGIRRPTITTDPFPNARKIYVEGRQPGVRVPMREIRVAPTRTHAGLTVENPPVTVYDTSGPYTDPEAQIDVYQGLAALRRAWIEGRGDVEELAAVSSLYGRQRAADAGLDANLPHRHPHAGLGPLDVDLRRAGERTGGDPGADSLRELGGRLDHHSSSLGGISKAKGRASRLGARPHRLSGLRFPTLA